MKNNKLKIALLVIFIIFLFTLDWAALPNISKGEPDPHLEYGIIVFILIVFGVMVSRKIFSH
ncbi:hypothetical protein COY23_02140 [bacterium (Candidatus Torokbacteria) CG_4_10_14_0_2_um_filter_35_8]|nr:MAG: hypothetical protein COY23_02140 [bacterium (Candidatus Torokbacteria) CG_4_10_14_0_2_um_filter_35_8]